MSKKNAINPKQLLYIILATGILVALALGQLSKARDFRHRNQCQENMLRIDNAKQQWAIKNNGSPDAKPTVDELIKADILKEPLKCPGGGTYNIGTISESPSCTLSGVQVLSHNYAIAD